MPILEPLHRERTRVLTTTYLIESLDEYVSHLFRSTQITNLMIRARRLRYVCETQAWTVRIDIRECSHLSGQSIVEL